MPQPWHNGLPGGAQSQARQQRTVADLSDMDLTLAEQADPSVDARDGLASALATLAVVPMSADLMVVRLSVGEAQAIGDVLAEVALQDRNEHMRQLAGALADRLRSRIRGD
jgi:hypothetical protein